MPNIVEIIVRAKDMTGEGFGKAEAKATGLGATLTKFAAYGGAALALVGVESVRMAAKFDQSMELIHTQAGVPLSALAGLKSGVLALASQVGFSPDSLAESLYHVESNFAGMKLTSQQALNVVKIAAEGARVGMAPLVDVTNALTSILASGIAPGKDYAAVMGSINAAVGAGDMKMQDYVEALATGVVPVVKGYGLTLNDVNAVLATFGDLNIRGAHAGTQLRMSVQAIAVPAATAKKTLADIGMTTTQMAQDMLHGGLMKALGDLETHFRRAGISAKDMGPYITAIFGKKAGAGIALLLENYTRLQGKYKVLNEGAHSFGSAWQATLAQTSTVFAQLKGWAEALMISIGEKLLPVVKAVGVWMLQNKGVIEVTLAVLAALVGIIGVYVTVVKAAMVATKIWEAVQALLNGEMVANPIGLMVTLIGLLVLSLIYAYKHSAAFRDILHEAGVVAVAAFRWIVRAAEDVWNWIRSHWPLLLAILLGPVATAIYMIVTHFAQLRHDAAAVLDDIGHFFASTFDMIRHDAAAVVDDIVNFFATLPGRIMGAIGSIGSDVWHSVTSGLGSLAHLIGLGTGGIAGAATGGVHGGLRLVGEYGPELVRLPYGSSVTSAAQTQGMLGGGGGGGPMQLELVGGGDDLLLRWLRNAIRIRGGNVQQVLGTGGP